MRPVEGLQRSPLLFVGVTFRKSAPIKIRADFSGHAAKALQNMFSVHKDGKPKKRLESRQNAKGHQPFSLK